ncbi:hypothetical protein ABTO49_21425, partial [Acinetobacter baumannii]
SQASGGGFRFEGKSVEAQSLNGLMDAGLRRRATVNGRNNPDKGQHSEDLKRPDQHGAEYAVIRPKREAAYIARQMASQVRQRNAL